MHVVVVVGARPNFMKAAPVVSALHSAGVRCDVVHTGQHFDAKMSDVFFRTLGLPDPVHNLGIGGGSHAEQTGKIMIAFEPIVTALRPDWLVVVGDVNSTLACALVTAKLRDALGIRIAHLEAGLRSSDWSMPEEVNRVLTDHLSDLLLTPSRDADANLSREGIEDGRVEFVGNVMIDSLLRLLPAARARAMPTELGLKRGAYAVVTVHRPSNVDSPGALHTTCQLVRAVSRRMQVVWPVHPRIREALEDVRERGALPDAVLLEPLDYLEMLSLTDGAAIVLTDSGGLQEESSVLGVPCITLRRQTERPVTIQFGTNRLAPWPLDPKTFARSLDESLGLGRASVGERAPEGWDGKAATRVAAILVARGIIT
jgi:UDP-N-acetylglucosamine 2-epimerase (non-hydrolysing)